MKFKLSAFFLCGLLALSAIAIIPGCGNGEKITDTIEDNKPLVLATLKLAASKGTQEGLKKWSKSKPEAAKEAAQALARNLKDQILPYLDGEELKASAEINEFINSSLFKDVPNEVKDTITAAADVLDLYLPVPSADKLKPVQLEYLKAFLSGVQAGAARFSGNLTVEKTDRHWINGETKKDDGDKKEGDSAAIPRATRVWVTG